ncbi:hypothetical protein RSOLAG22IIIB_06943 [Rhizoctonia solani]|uniref:Uncharacterized protein n=1 Tax=Rhizoctonia solani TaxID=456999 RepID=A0A0K6GIM1_9AGAM|nr:hypothetical protein RSOLAG22IIIB_06943 [Rhizoctonia solani]
MRFKATPPANDKPMVGILMLHTSPLNRSTEESRSSPPTTLQLVKLPNVAFSYANSSKCPEDIDIDACTFSTGSSTILSPPTIPSNLAYPIVKPAATKSALSNTSELNSQFTHLNLSDMFADKSTTSLAPPRSMELHWTFVTKLLAPSDNPTVEALSGPNKYKWKEAMGKE